MGRPGRRFRRRRGDQPQHLTRWRPRRGRRTAVPAVGRGVRRQRDPPEAADGATAGHPGDLGGVHGRRGRVPPLRARPGLRPRHDGCV